MTPEPSINDAMQSSGRKRRLTVNDDEEDVKTQDHESPTEKRACLVIKDEPDDDDDGIKLLSLPEHLRDQSAIKQEYEPEPEARRKSLLTPPSSPGSRPPPPPPRYWHPAFPDRAVRCDRCNKTETVCWRPAAQSNFFNAGRPLFACTECEYRNNRYGGFICWADERGVYENNMTCGCRLPARAELTSKTPSGRLFFNCAMGRCRFFEWTDEFVTDRANLQDRVNTWVSDID
ncbi:hypothetical protein PG984_001458 [Apiospora sp. TS-2023a]